MIVQWRRRLMLTTTLLQSDDAAFSKERSSCPGWRTICYLMRYTLLSYRHTQKIEQHVNMHSYEPVLWQSIMAINPKVSRAGFETPQEAV